MRFFSPHSVSWARHNKQVLAALAGKRQGQPLPDPSGPCDKSKTGEHDIGHYGPGGSREICRECSVRFDS